MTLHLTAYFLLLLLSWWLAPLYMTSKQKNVVSIKPFFKLKSFSFSLSVSLSLYIYIYILHSNDHCYYHYHAGHKNSLLTAFSVCTNGKKLFACKQINSPDVINCLHGIRAISMIWIIYAHTHSTSTIVPLTNSVHIMNTVNHFVMRVQCSTDLWQQIQYYSFTVDD